MRFFTAVAFLFCMIGSLAGQKAVIDKIVGQVGDELILLSELEGNYALLSERGGTLPPDARCTIMENLLVSSLLLHQSRLDSLVISDEEVEAQLNARIDQILTLMGNDLEQFRSYYGMSVSEAKDEFREDLKNQILTQRMQGQLMSDVKVTPSEVKQFFSEIPIDSLPYFNSEVEIAEIVYKAKVNEEERAKAIGKLEKLKSQILEEEADFSELAKTWSDDPGSASAGGDLGMQKRGTFVPEFEAAAFNLEKGQLSDIIESEFGFHLLKLVERRGNNIHVFHILIKPEITPDDIQLASEFLDSVRNLIIVDSLSFSIAVKRFSDEKIQSYNNDGRLVNQQTGDTFFETSDLDPDIFFTIDTLEVGDVSAPFMLSTDRSDPTLRIIRMNSRTAPHRANLQQDYSKIQTATIEHKKARFLSEWVERRMNEAYIRIDTRYEGCPNLEPWMRQQNSKPSP